jgi:hypothetical protein
MDTSQEGNATRYKDIWDHIQKGERYPGHVEVVMLGFAATACSGQYCHLPSHVVLADHLELPAARNAA